jgi:hypothetical protein
MGTPASEPVGGGGVPQVPWFEPGGKLQTSPAQQSLLDEQAPPAATQVVLAAWQWRTPLESGVHGVPLQHSDEIEHTPPAAMQQPGWPV